MVERNEKLKRVTREERRSKMKVIRVKSEGKRSEGKGKKGEV